jgi:hypothetical protein
MHKGKAEDQKGKSAPATEFLTIGTPANRETVTIIAVGAAGPTGASVDFTPALAKNRSASPILGLRFRRATSILNFDDHCRLGRNSSSCGPSQGNRILKGLPSDPAAFVLIGAIGHDRSLLSPNVKEPQANWQRLMVFPGRRGRQQIHVSLG